MTIPGDNNNDNDGAATLKSGTVEGDLSSEGAVVGDTSTTTNERSEGGAVLLTEEQLLSMTNHVSDDEDEEFVEENHAGAPAAARMEEKAADRKLPRKEQQQHPARRGISSKKQEELQSDATSTTTLLSKKQESVADHSTTTTNMATSGAGSHGSTTTTRAVLSPPTELLTATQGEYTAPGAHRIHVNSSADTAAATASTTSQEPPPIAVMATLVKTTTEETPVEDLEARVRQQVLSEAVVAQQVAVLPDGIRDEDDASSTHRHKKSSDPTPKSSSRRLWILLLVAFNVIGVATGVGVILSSREKDTPSSTTVNTETDAIDISEDENEDNEDRDEDNDESPPDWWIEISPDVVLPNSPQRRAYEWMTANIFGSQAFGGPKESHAYALVTFYYATGGESSWLRNDGWLDPSIDLCDWYPGTMCTDMPAGGSPGRLRQLQTGLGAKLFSNLQLPDNGLVGTIPTELFLIDSLRTLDLSGNQLTGTTNDPLATLFQSNLREVRLEGNNITGTIRPAICTPFTDVALPQGGVLAMDCLDTTIVRCPCCTICCLNGADCQTQ